MRRLVSISLCMLVAGVVAVGAPSAGARGKKVAAKPSEGCGTSAVAAGQEKITTSSGGTERWYFRHVPPAHDGERPLPLVLDLHGYVEGATIHTAMSALGTLGDDEGFVTVTPEGSGAPIPAWNTAVGSADVQFVADLLDEVMEQLCIDERRVYVTGLSMGAFMTSTLSCALADRFAAAAPVAGIRDPQGCDPSRPVPVVAFHGTDDQLVSYEGGYGPGVADLPTPDGKGRLGDAAVADGPSIPQIAAAWADRNGCTSRQTEKRVAADVVRISFECPAGAEVQLYRVEGGGHTWPGSEFSRAIGAIGATTFSISANDVMWKFFERHPLRPTR